MLSMTIPHMSNDAVTCIESCCSGCNVELVFKQAAVGGITTDPIRQQVIDKSTKTSKEKAQ